MTRADPLLIHPALPRHGRRRLLGAGLAALLGGQGAPLRAADRPTGWVTPPQPVPAVPVQLAEGGSQLLPKLFEGRITAVQLMFTSCSSTCPTQGAAFGALASRLHGVGWQLLSLSIDALGDTPQRLAAWQKPFGAHPSWRLGLPAVVDVERLRDYFHGAPSRAGTHTAQVFLVDARARLAWRSGDNPALAEVVGALNMVTRQS